MELLSILAITQLWMKIVFMLLLKRDKTHVVLLLNAAANWRFCFWLAVVLEQNWSKHSWTLRKSVPDPKLVLSWKPIPNTYCQPWHAVVKLLSISDAITITRLLGSVLSSCRNRLQTHVLRITCFYNSRSPAQDLWNISKATPLLLLLFH